MGIEKLKRKDTYSITIKPSQDFADDSMGTRVNGWEWSGKFRTKDFGLKGGMVATIGKTKTSVEKYGREKAPTTVQRYLVQKSDFTIKEERLIPTNPRGKKEFESIKKHGELYYPGGDYFAPVSEKKRFQELKYFENPKRGRNMVRGITESETREARGKGVPETIVSKMKLGYRLSTDEEKILNGKGLTYVPGYPKPGTIGVRSYLRKYSGRTPARMRAIEKARGVWVGMTPTERSISMPGGEI